MTRNEAFTEIAEIGRLVSEIGKKITAVAEFVEAVLPEGKPVIEERETSIEEKPQAEESAYTFTDVRKRLSTLSRDGHTDEVKELLEKYGAKKLSDVKEEHYAAILADAEVIANAE